MQTQKAAERAMAGEPQKPLSIAPPQRTIYPATITAGILAVKRAVHEVGKTGRNKFHGYSYATEADVLEVLREPMNKAGLAMIPSQVGEAQQIRIPKDKGGGDTIITQITIDFLLIHESGDVWPVPIRITGHGQDSQDKGPYKAMAGARKYAHIHVFGLTTTDDPEFDSPPPRQNSPAQSTRAAPAPSPGPPPQVPVQGTSFLSEQSMSDALKALAEAGEKSALDLASYWKSADVAALRKRMSPEQVEQFTVSKNEWKQYHTDRGTGE